jgi:DNA (cytosine-5)-methyltransferase 1
MDNGMKVASFFSGIGGFDLGFERAGMDIVFQCEINTYCQKILKKHWPNIRLVSDIHKLHSDDIPSSDLWCGGFPCQDLSLANQGKRKGLGGQRSGLFYKFAELLSGHLPRWVVIENVPGLLNSSSGEDFKTLLQKLDELGYGISWRVLDAKYFGTPQRRRRVIIVASLGTLLSAQVLFEPGSTKIAFKQGLGERENSSSSIRTSVNSANIFVIQHATIGRKHTAGPQAKGYRNDGETYTLDSRGTSDAVCKTVDTFGMREASGISGTLDGNRFRAIGNAVAVPVFQWVGMRIMKVESSSKEKLLGNIYRPTCESLEFSLKDSRSRVPLID